MPTGQGSPILASGGALAALLSAQASAGVPPPLVVSTVKAAAGTV